MSSVIRFRRLGFTLLSSPVKRYFITTSGLLTVIPLLAFVSSNLIVIWSTWTINWKLFVTVLLGLVLLVFIQIFKKDTPPLELKSGGWFVAWLAGLAVLSYLAGDLDASARMGFWTSVLVTTVYSVVVYFVAIATRLDRATTEEHMRTVAEEAEAEDSELDGSAP